MPGDNVPLKHIAALEVMLELLAVVKVFQQWKPYLGETRYPVHALSDYKNLTYFTTTTELNRRQVRWWEELAYFNFSITIERDQRT